MDYATHCPQWMRYSCKTHCRAVAAIVAGISPGAAAHSVGASRATGHRWWRRYATAGCASARPHPRSSPGV